MLTAGLIASAAAPAGAGPASRAERVKEVFAAPGASSKQCSERKPCSLTEAQADARRLAKTGVSVDVVLAGGRYELTAPLRFDARDSAKPGATVTYRAAAGAEPIITGATRVTGWTPTATPNVWRASTPVGLDTRQLYIDGTIAPRAAMSISPSDIALNRTGFTITSPALRDRLARVADPSRLELQALLSFTNRYMPFESISGSAVTMAQPSWDNNTFGYDILQFPFRAPLFSIENAPELLDADGQWAIKPAAGELLYRAAPGVNPNSLDVELPRLESLMHVAGTYDAPASNLSFSGLTFTGTSWMHPSSNDGLASQQTGTFVTGVSTKRPADAFDSCRVGCSGFESTRGAWGMVAGAVQVSAATNIDFVGNTFTNLGSQGLGVGNDGGANATGIDYGAKDIRISANTFHDLAGGGIIVGGSRIEAHHPSRPEKINADIVIDNNRIRDIGIDYKDQNGIFVSYVDNLMIRNNSVRDVPYSAIGIGYGWGAWDAGGNPVYEQRGTYQHWPRYDANTPTTASDYSIINNEMDNVVESMNDGACVYNLGAVPRSVIKGNVCTDLGNDRLDLAWPIYLDEASRFYTVSNNVMLRIPNGVALHTNRQPAGQPNSDLVAFDNYASANAAAEDFTTAPRSSSTNLVAVTEPNLPIEASRIVFEAGPEGRDRFSEAAPPLGAQVAAPAAALAPGESVTIKTSLRNFDAKQPITGLSATLRGPAGWTITRAPLQPTRLLAGGAAELAWTVKAPAGVQSTDLRTFTVQLGYTYSGSAVTTTRTFGLRQQTPPVTSLQTYAGGGASMQFGEFNGIYSLAGYSGDTIGLFGINQDSYGSIFRRAAAGATSTVTVRVVGYDRVARSSKAGIAVRNNLGQAGAAQGYVSLVVQADGVTLFGDRDGDGLMDEFYPLRSGPIDGPLWLRLQRTGATVTGAYSTDGQAWTVLPQTLTLTNPAAALDAGMVYVPNSGITPDSTVGTATFDNFTIN